MRKRVKITLPKLIKEILNEDLIYFDLKMENLCNIIVREMGYDQTLRLHDRLSNKEKTSINFNLNRRNSMFFSNMLEESEENVEAEYFRRLLSTYANLHPSIRERIVKKTMFIELEDAVKKKLGIKIAKGQEVYNVIPLGMERDKKTGYNLLKIKLNEEIVLYKVTDIELLKIL